MKLENAFGLNTSSLGLRFILVNLVPTTFLVFFTLIHLWSGAPESAPVLNEVAEEIRALEAQESVVLIVSIIVISLVIQPLQLSLVRILEGYWNAPILGDLLSHLGKALHKRRRQALERATQSSKTADQLSPTERTNMEVAAWRLRQYYPSEDQILPMALGNVLRAAEEMPGKRYGLDAVVAWPRLYPLISDKLTSTLADQRDQLDIASRFCLVFLLATLISLAFLWRHEWWLIVPSVTLALAWVSYKAAIEAAVAYGEGIQAAFELHRFDLLKALHLPLPDDRESERKVNQDLADFLRQGMPVNFQYDHHDMHNERSQ